jgi:hypothetical protein
MRRATRIVAAALGVFAGIAGPEHGIFEIMRGNTRPETLIFPSMGPPCDPEAVWHACEPAMSIIPNYLITGILASLVGLVTILWSVLCLHRKRGGWGLIGLSILLLLVGGGLVPPIIGIIGGILATRVHAPIKGRATGASRFLSQLWPWALVAFFVMLWGQFAIGFFFNDWFMRSGFLIPVAILGLLVLSILSALAHDTERAAGAA